MTPDNQEEPESRTYTFTNAEMELICDAFNTVIALSPPEELDDEWLEATWKLFERIDPTESNHAAHLRDNLRNNTDYFSKDDPHYLTDEGKDIG